MAFDFPFVKEAVTQLFQKSSCEEYPFKPKEAFDGYRGRIVFHPELCIHCGMCERVCAGGAISDKVVRQTEEGDYIQRTFFLGSCTFCNYCADFCSKHAIELSKDFNMTARDPKDLIVEGTYFHKKPVRPAPRPAAPAAAKPAETKPAEAETPPEGCQSAE